MPPLTELPARKTFTRFVRVEEEIFVAPELDEFVNHKIIAETDGLIPKIDELRDTNPTEVDAGYLKVERFDDIPHVSLSNNSDRLNLPVLDVRQEARGKTVVVFQAKFPDAQVSNFY